MIDFLPLLKDKNFLLKVAILFLLIATSFLVTTVIGIVIAFPIFGSDVLNNLMNLDTINNEANLQFMKYFQVISQIGVFILPVVAFAYLENRNIKNYLKIDRPPNRMLLLFSTLAIVASIPAINWTVSINEQMKLPEFLKGIENWMRESEDRTDQLTNAFLNVSTFGGLIINLIIIALLAAIGEEFLFRGVVLRLFRELLKNNHLAVFLSAILFSALHMQFFGFLPRTILGVLFGYLFIWTGSLWVPIILHFLFNGVTVVAAYLYNIGLITTDVDSFGSSDNLFVIGISFIASLFFLYLVLRLSINKGIEGQKKGISI